MRKFATIVLTAAALTMAVGTASADDKKWVGTVRCDPGCEIILKPEKFSNDHPNYAGEFAQGALDNPEKYVAGVMPSEKFNGNVYVLIDEPGQPYFTTTDLVVEYMKDQKTEMKELNRLRKAQNAGS